jgi:hypothetical protein
MKLTAKILECDVPDANGRIYPSSEIEKTLPETNLPLVGTIGCPPELKDFDNAFICTSVIMEGKDVIGEIQIANTATGEILKRLIMDDQIVFRTYGTGKVSDDGVVSELNIIGVSAHLKEK